MKKVLILPFIHASADALGSLKSEILDPAQVCPIFTCANLHNGDINMDEQVFCFKNNVFNPFEINLKTCKNGEFCHSQLNRCTLDPYA